MAVLEKKGFLARQHGYDLVLKVQRSAAGFYLGTSDHEGPVTRESQEYWPTREEASAALAGVEGIDWTQRDHV